ARPKGIPICCDVRFVACHVRGSYGGQPAGVGERGGVVARVGVLVPSLRVGEGDGFDAARVGGGPAAVRGVVAVGGIVHVDFRVVVGQFSKGFVRVEAVQVDPRPDFPIGIEQAFGEVVPGVVGGRGDGPELVRVV